MKVLELFSGVGGMSFALKAAEVDSEIVAVEINPVANQVYKLNFPTSTLLQKNILSLTIEEVNKFGPDMLLMSPPCQPFTRVGLNKDLEDTRSDPLKHIMRMLPEIPSLKFILLENVKGFETSIARNTLISCLEDLEFNFREFLLSPTYLHVPNSRTRYYLLAKKSPLEFIFQGKSVMDCLPKEIDTSLKDWSNHFPEIKSIENILETQDIDSTIYKDHLLPQKLLEKRLWVMDIVTKFCNRSCCFTKAYGHYIEGTGSIFCSSDISNVDSILASESRNSVDPEKLKSLNLRFFTGREVARLMSFPENFNFPEHTTKKQKYRLLGNSLNVKVVATLIKIMFPEPLACDRCKGKNN